MKTYRRTLAWLTLAGVSFGLSACSAAHSAEQTTGVEVVASSTSSADGMAVFSVVVQSVAGNRVVLATRAFVNEDGMVSLSQSFRPPSEVGATIRLKGAGHHAEASLDGVSGWADVSKSSQIVWTVQ